ncbi:LytTR family DNA-binding domain-containing protein [Roseibium sp. HPY-6]|uniref:LytTR family DNA-binding domain-containing protein n=1 Tax=Roseibium sp. HPY-6 TaxID=3229852 RepID=UPI00338DCF26
MVRNQTTQFFLLALSAAWLLASTQIQRPEGWPIAGLYAYWSTRILLEAGLFAAFLELLGRLPGLKGRLSVIVIVAALVSLVPFALAVTALDLILGLPELDELVSGAQAPAGSGNAATGQTHIGSFLLELVYLSDNHLVLCFLLSIPLIFRTGETQSVEDSHEAQPVRDQAVETENPAPDDLTEDEASVGIGYQRHLDPPLQAPVLRVEAQEHYVRLINATENRMVLYRFNDIVSELPHDRGMQVHRSHWVAYEIMDRLVREEGRLWLDLTGGERVPVSRKYAEDVRQQIQSADSSAKKAAT